MAAWNTLTRSLSIDGFNNFFGLDNFIGTIHNQTIVEQGQELSCHSESVEIVQKRLVIQDLAKRCAFRIQAMLDTFYSQLSPFKGYHGGGVLSSLQGMLPRQASAPCRRRRFRSALLRAQRCALRVWRTGCEGALRARFRGCSTSTRSARAAGGPRASGGKVASEMDKRLSVLQAATGPKTSCA